MKKINVLAVSFFAAALIVGAFAVGSGTQAQATPVACSFLQSSVSINLPITLTASGGNGSYSWSIPGLLAGTAFSTNTTQQLIFNVPGNYAVNVTSGGTVAICNVAVTAVESPAPGGIEFPDPGLPNTGELN